MKFTCSIDLDNDAFADPTYNELARLLMVVSSRVNGLANTQTAEGGIRDINGNTVGQWVIMESEATV